MDPEREREAVLPFGSLAAALGLAVGVAFMVALRVVVMATDPHKEPSPEQQRLRDIEARIERIERIEQAIDNPLTPQNQQEKP